MYEKDYHKHDLADSTFLVTGGGGFIGSHLVEYLLKKGAGKVKVLDNFSTGSMQNLIPFKSFPALEVVEGDIRDLDTCKASMKEV